MMLKRLLLLSFWGPVTFQGELLNFGGVSTWFQKATKIADDLNQPFSPLIDGIIGGELHVDVRGISSMVGNEKKVPSF